jgi:hypothetical protein
MRYNTTWKAQEVEMNLTTDHITEIASALEDFQQAMCAIAGPYADGEDRLIKLAYGTRVKGKVTLDIKPDDIEWVREFIEDLHRSAEYLCSEMETAMERFEDAVQYAQEDADDE